MVLEQHFSNPNSQLRRLLEAVDADTELREAAEPPTRQVQRRLSPDDVAELVAHYQAGVRVPDLIEQYGIHRTTVLEHLRRQGVLRSPDTRKLTDADAAEAAELYRAGWSLARVGKQYGVTASTIRREFLLAGIVIRPRLGRG